MNDFKAKFLRRIRKFHIGSVGALATGIAVITTLLNLGYYATLGQEVGDNIYQLVLTAINCLFYLMLTKNFIQAKQSNRLNLINYNLLIITIFEYIFPTIQLFLFSFGVNGIYGLGIGLASTLLSSSAIGIAYFIFLGRLNKGIGKNNPLILKILGGLILLSNIFSAGMYFAIAFDGLILSTVSDYLALIINMLEGIGVILFGLVYFLYPFYVTREQKFGY